MGRVDEAMRRVSTQGSPAGVPIGSVPATFSSEADPKPREDIQIEANAVSGDALEHADIFRAVSATDPDELATAIEAPSATPSSTERPTTIFHRLDPKLAGKIVVDQAMKPMCREQYRRLAATLHQIQIERGLKVIIVVSAIAAEGKTLTATNLALTLSESYHRQVLLIDGDLRRPSLHSVLNIDAQTGLSEGLSAEGEPRLTLHQVTSRLALLPAGRPMSDPMAGLTSERMKRIVVEARGAFDWVIVDTPPVGLLPDGHLLASMGDGALLVVKAGGPAYELIRRSVESIGRDRMLGVVLNKAQEHTDEGYYYRYDYRAYSPSAR